MAEPEGDAMDRPGEEEEEEEEEGQRPSQKRKIVTGEENETKDEKAVNDEEKTEDERYIIVDDTDPLGSLPPDALLSALCRVPSSHHDELWRTCRTIRTVLDSEAYASERAASGWAEVATRIIPGEELYDRDHPDGPDMYDGLGDDSEADEDEDEDEEAKRKRREEKRQEKRREDIETYYSELGHYDPTYGYHDIETEVKVDGRVAGSIKLVLVPRDGESRIFHEATDAHSGELQEVGWTLCDASGRPKVRSIKDADPSGLGDVGGFLHVVSVQVKEQYRPSSCTNVVAMAVRSAMCNPRLDRKFTLATAISDAGVYLTKDEKFRRETIDMNDIHRCLGGGRSRPVDEDRDKEVAEEKKRLDIRWKECSRLDTMTLLRAGFEQVPEVVGSEKDKPIWLFATAGHFAEPPLTYEEALEVPLHEPPELPPEPEGVNDDLLHLVMKASNEYKAALDSVARVDSELRKQEQQLAENEEQLEQIVEMNRETEASILELQRELDESKGHREEMLPRLSDDELREIETLIENSQARIEIESNRASTTAAAVEELQRTLREKRPRIDRNMAMARESLAEQRQELSKTVEKLKTEVKALVEEKGASIRKSHVLHCSARFRLSEYIDFLLDFVPANERADAINDVDSNGATPLQLAVAGVPELDQADEQYNFVRKLLELGAEKGTVDSYGRTALGQYRYSFSSRNDFVHAFNLSAISASRGDTKDAWRPMHARMEEALMPVQGETDADRDAKGTEDEDQTARDAFLRQVLESDDEDDEEDGE